MKTLQMNFTTPEQSKRLLELGVPTDSADLFYSKFECETFGNKPTLCYDKKYSDIVPDGYEKDYLPCWSVGRLIEIIDICANEDSSDDCDEEYPSTTKVMRELNMDYITYLVISIEIATKLKIIDFSKLEE